MLLKSVTNDEDMIIAGLMHDSLEDVPDYTYDMLVKDCGLRVADIVLGVTEDKKLPYRDRKVLYLANLKTGKIESVLVSVADKLHNLKSLADLKEDKKYNTDFLQTQIMLYKEVLKIGKERLNNKNGENHILVLELEKELVNF
jgi:(p)ppGpp synthase/HD superfamily hydrolase